MMDLLKELASDYDSEAVDVMDVITEAVKELYEKRGNSGVDNKTIKAFIKGNQKLTTAAAAKAFASHQMYKTNKRNLVSLFAKTPYEKRMIRKIVDAMTKTGAFKLHRTRYAEGGGRYYELTKIKAGF
jgi:hypothetical protein